MSSSTEVLLPFDQNKQLVAVQSNARLGEAIAVVDEIQEYRSLKQENISAIMNGPSVDYENHTTEEPDAGQDKSLLEKLDTLPELSSNVADVSDGTLLKLGNESLKTNTSISANANTLQNHHEDLEPTKLVSLNSSQDELQKLDGYYARDHESIDLQRLASGKMAGDGWGTGRIQWAPLNVPLRRRLQTLVVLCHTLSIVLSASIFFFTAAIPLFWPLLAPYLIYCMYSSASTSGSLSRRSEFLRSSPVWSLFASYFPARLHRSQELPPTRKYIFGYHPHGIISMGAFAAFSTEALGFSQLFPGIKNTLLTLDSNFRIPYYRDYALALGLASVSRESCENLLSTGGINNEGMGRAVTIVVGGARESLVSEPNTLRLVLQCRKGFIKMALRTGADLVPVIGFGENDLYYQVQPNSHPKIHRFQLLVKKLLGFTVPLFHARGVLNYDFGLMPYRRPLNIVVGRPIMVIQNRNPNEEEINRLHKVYVEELERVWRTWKKDFAPMSKETPVYEE